MNINRARISMLLVGSIASVSQLSAQMAQTPVSDLVPGARVRATIGQSRGSVEGTVRGVTGDTLWVWQEAGISTPIERETVGRLEVSLGRRSNALKGMLIGGGVGLLSGLLYPEGSLSDDRSEAVLTVALSGALWGALIGALIKTERWRTVGWNSSARPVAVPEVRVSRGDLFVGLRINP